MVLTFGDLHDYIKYLGEGLHVFAIGDNYSALQVYPKCNTVGLCFGKAYLSHCIIVFSPGVGKVDQATIFPCKEPGFCNIGSPASYTIDTIVEGPNSPPWDYPFDGWDLGPVKDLLRDVLTPFMSDDNMSKRALDKAIQLQKTNPSASPHYLERQAWINKLKLLSMTIPDSALGRGTDGKLYYPMAIHGEKEWGEHLIDVIKQCCTMFISPKTFVEQGLRDFAVEQLKDSDIEVRCTRMGYDGWAAGYVEYGNRVLVFAQ